MITRRWRWTVALTCAVAWAAWLTHPAAGDDRPTAVGLPADRVELRTEREGDELYVIIADARGEHRLRAEQVLEVMQRSAADEPPRGWLFVGLNITSWVGVLWVAMGLLGQLAFTGRMLVQWLMSEHAGRSVVPPIFWWMSLVGASMLLAYFIWRKDIVGILGQGTGWMIYARNIWMIHRPRHRATDGPGPHALAMNREGAKKGEVAKVQEMNVTTSTDEEMSHR